MATRAIGSHHSSNAKSVVWLTPPEIIAALAQIRRRHADPGHLDQRQIERMFGWDEG